MGRILGTGNDNVPILDMPPQDNLGVGLAVLLSKFREQRFFQQGLVPMAQGIPGLDDHALFAEEFFQLPLLEIGVQLCLQDSGLHFADREDFLDLFLVEVGQANGTHLALLVRLFHLAVARHIVACGLVDEQQIDIIRIQTLQRFFYCVLLLIEAGPQFGLQEDLLPLQA